MNSTSKRGIHVATLAAVLLAAHAGQAAYVQSSPIVTRGKYLATAADCVACHTKPGGKAFAGGLALKTPFGTLVSSNITPDPTEGIGSWSDDEFVSALRDGLGRGGKHLYPAMPYPAYSKMTREDALAIRAYLRTVSPAPIRVVSNHLPFPFNIRATLVVWNAINFRSGTFAQDRSKSPPWNRGHYLVDALGHCGACHTPKTIMGADNNSLYLKGARLQGWVAPNITTDPRKGIGKWSIEDLVSYLKTGANRFALASGGMGEEVVHSSSNMTDSDVHAIAIYLQSLSSTTPESRRALEVTDARMVAGRAIYRDVCAACHTGTGTGAASLFPRLARSPGVQSDDPTTLIHTVLFGSQAAATRYAPTAPAMPSFAWRLSDDQTAAVITYIRNSWGNAAAPVSPTQVQSLRKGAHIP